MTNKNSNRQELISNFVSNLLRIFGEDASREGLIETPQRVFRMYDELLSGYNQNPKTVFKTFKSNGYNNLVSVTDIDFYSLCEHHIIPFFGKVHIGYVPNGKILGLSKFARLVEIFARRLQTQENLTKQIFDSLTENLHPQGIIVTVEAEHLCISMRGIRKRGFITKTTMKDNFMERKKDLLRQFYRDIKHEGSKT